MIDIIHYSTEEAAEILEIPFWELVPVCRFLKVPKIRGKYYMKKKHLKFIEKIYQHFIR